MSWLLKYFLTYTMTWLSTIPHPVASWAHYVSENYQDKDIDDVEEPNYSDDDDYEDEPNIDIEFTTQETVSEMRMICFCFSIEIYFKLFRRA